MSNVIRFLETLGSQPALSPAGYAASVAALDCDTEQQLAMLQRDGGTLNGLLGGHPLMAMFVATPDGGEEPQDSPDHTDDDGKETEDLPESTEEPK